MGVALEGLERSACGGCRVTCQAVCESSTLQCHTFCGWPQLLLVVQQIVMLSSLLSAASPGLILVQVMQLSVL